MQVTGKAYILKGSSVCAERLTLPQAFTRLESELSEQARLSDIFKAHLEILQDPMLNEAIAEAVESGLDEQAAIQSACSSVCALFESIEDEYLKARVDDVKDVCKRLQMFVGGHTQNCVVPDGCILVASELLPSDMAALDLTKIKGIICANGSTTSHIAILAHAHGIAIQTGKDISSIEEGAVVSVTDNMLGGEIKAKVHRAGKALYANAGSLEDIQMAIEAGADGIGLLRTEFLYLDSTVEPQFEQQKAMYAQAMKLCEGKCLTIRTMDVGGDKTLPWLTTDKEENPFLGLRGIRLSLKYPHLLATQLQAIAQAAMEVPGCKVRVMFPMVCTADEVAEAKMLLKDAVDADTFDMLEFGAMIETPAAAMSIEQLSSQCSFFSIGSNDLTQYVMAADRGNSAVAYLYNHNSAPVLKLISRIITDAHECGCTVGICGEMASDPTALEFLLNSGIDSLSLSRI